MRFVLAVLVAGLVVAVWLVPSALLAEPSTVDREYSSNSVRPHLDFSELRLAPEISYIYMEARLYQPFENDWLGDGNVSFLINVDRSTDSGASLGNAGAEYRVRVAAGWPFALFFLEEWRNGQWELIDPNQGWSDDSAVWTKVSKYDLEGLGPIVDIVVVSQASGGTVIDRVPDVGAASFNFSMTQMHFWEDAGDVSVPTTTTTTTPATTTTSATTTTTTSPGSTTTTLPGHTEWRFWSDPAEGSSLDFSRLALVRELGMFSTQVDFASAISIESLGSGNVSFLLNTDQSTSTGSPLEGSGAEYRVRVAAPEPGDFDPGFPDFFLERWQGGSWSEVARFPWTVSRGS